MLGRVARWMGLGPDDADERASEDVGDWASEDVEYGGDGPTRRYTCPECGGTVTRDGPDRQATCPDCETVFKNVLVADAAICPACDARIDDFEFYPETRRDAAFASCSACGYRWESDPR